MSKKYKKKTWEEKREEINEVIEKMDKAIEGHFTSPEQMKEYLSFMSKFHQYSPRNTSLIQSQFSGAKAVGSFKFWRDKEFTVNKGEKGIQILVPNKTTPRFKDESGKWKSIRSASEDQRKKIESGQLEEQKSRLYFNFGHVFDVSQTNAKAEDLPEIFPNKWMEGEVGSYQAVMDSLNSIAHEMDVSVGSPFGELGSAKGAFYYGVEATNKGHIGLNPRNSELQNVKTMIHELAHAKLHHKEHENYHKLSDAEKEFQAEMVAYSTASYFGIDTSDYSLGYLANWTKDKELKDKEQLLREVRDTSVSFIEVIEQDLLIAKESDQVQEQGEPSVELVEWTKKMELEHSSTEEYNNHIQHIYAYENSLININESPDGKHYEIIASREIDDFEPYLVEETNSLEALEPYIDKIKHNEEKKYLLLTYNKLNNMDVEHCTLYDIEQRFYEGESFQGVKHFNEFSSEEYSLIDPEQVKEPSVIFNWSELDVLDERTVIPYAKANEITTSMGDMGYYKTSYSLLIPDDKQGIDVVPMDQLNVGEGKYLNIHDHVRCQVKNEGVISNEQWDMLNDSFVDYLTKSRVDGVQGDKDRTYSISKNKDYEMER